MRAALSAGLLLLALAGAHGMAAKRSPHVSRFHAPWGGETPREVALLALPQTQKARGAGLRRRSSRIKYFITSGSKFFDTRVRAINRTWGQEVPHGDLTVLGDVGAQGVPADLSAMRFVATACDDDHSVGLCCKYAEGVRQAHAQMTADPSVEWAYFIDDDVYVRPKPLSRALAAQRDHDDRGVVVSVMGCAADGCGPGICGGAGFAVNRKAIERAIGGNDTALLQAEMDFCYKCGNWSDVALAEVYRAKGVEFRSVDGSHGWKMKKTQFDQALAGADPILFHYIKTPQQMDTMHQLFTGAGTQRAEKYEPRRCAKFQGRVACARSEEEPDTPWFQDDIDDLRGSSPP